MKAALQLTSERNQIIIYRHEEEVSPISSNDWLETAPLFPKFYYEDRDSPHFFASSGRIASFFSLPHMDPLHHSYIRLIGWRHFLPTLAKEWLLFPKEYHFVPKYELFAHKGRTYYAENSLTPLRTPFPPLVTAKDIAPLSLKWKESLPSKEQWLAAVRGRSIAKLVLARRWTLYHTKPLLPLSLLRAIPKHNHFHLFIQLAPHLAFLSATPERLYRREANRLTTEALAGTTLFLKHLDKEHREFSFVEEAIHQALDQLCTVPPTISPLTTLNTSSLSHLYRSFQAPLKPGISDSQILSTLHPTPAVGGWPRSEALLAIQALEPFHRGLYAAPVGWTSPHTAEWLVAIRSGLITGHNLHLYSGAGLVDGSEAETEWEELNHKLDWFLSVFPHE